MISVVHRPESPQSASAIRVLALLALTWALVGPTAGVAEADACAYASVGPDGAEVVAVAGSIDWPTLPPCPKPPPTPKPPPSPTPTPTPPEPPCTPTHSPDPTPKPPPTRKPPKPTPPPPPAPEPPAPAPAPPAPAPRPVAPRPVPPPAPAPPPTPTPTPTRTPPKPAPGPSASPVTYPAYHHAKAPDRTTHSTTSPVIYVLLITAPAVVAVAALRPR